MVNKFLAICAVLIIALSAAQALEFNVTYMGDVDQATKDAVNNYNTQVNNAPGIAKSLLGNENLHMFLTNNETKEYAAVTVDGLITQFGPWNDSDNDGNFDPWQAAGTKPTMEVRVNLDKLNEISSAQNPAQAFQDAWGKDIQYKGLNAGTGVKTFLMGVGMWFLGIFS